MVDALRALLAGSTMSVYDYFTVFEELLYRVETDVALLYIDLMREEMQELMTSCYDDLQDHYLYVCLYGKA